MSSSDSTAQAVQPTAKPWQFSLRTLLVAMTLFCVFFAFVYYISLFISTTRTASFRTYTANNFKQVALALHNYDDSYRRLPFPNIPSPDYNGEPLYSWRFAIIGLMEQLNWDGPYQDYSQPWDSLANQFFHNYGFFNYSNGPNDPDPNAYNTYLFLITGPGTAFGDGESELPKSITELPSDMIIAVEVRDSGVHWMQPGDFDIRTMPRTINAKDGRGVSGPHRGGFHVIFADGSVAFIGNDIPFETLEKFFSIEETKKHSRDELLDPFEV